MKWLKWAGVVLVAVVATALVVLFFGMTATDRYQRSHEAIDRASSLAWGCQAYFRHPKSEGKYPTTLADLLNPPFDGGPFVEGSHFLKDPWGKPFKYALIQNEKGEWEPYVWTERTVNGKTTLLGAKRTAGGEPMEFGAPE